MMQSVIFEAKTKNCIINVLGLKCIKVERRITLSFTIYILAVMVSKTWRYRSFSRQVSSTTTAVANSSKTGTIYSWSFMSADLEAKCRLCTSFLTFLLILYRCSENRFSVIVVSG